MNDSPNREVIVFNAALQLPATQRAAYLNEACGGDALLLRRVEVLLQAHERAGAFLAESDGSQKSGITSKAFAAPGETISDRVGRYKLLQQIGEGGCGVVYMAEQEEPVRRRVALKVIKLGMDTKSVIARFEAERQALAIMDHPNIAKVLDAGATETGRPYFVMELVRGVKITDFCDENELSTKERLKLFIQVCQAVQHAHQKGVIHRDIKPSNILVTINDGVPVPMVIDFGIAKATQGKLTDQTLFTAFEQFIGTPAYMSPEQAVLTSVEVDTRSDIYSLGVLLYELLTGQTPFAQKELLASGLDEMRRTILEKEPVRPSTRLSAMVPDALATVASRRQSQPPQLIHLMRGDLDWIVMKCLQKDRARRYETANGLAMDLTRHLHHEPVLARPDSQAYRVAKFVRRHRTSVAFATVILIALVGGLVGTITQAHRATRHALLAEAAESETRRQLYLALLEQARATVRSGEMGHRVRALDALRRAAAITNSVDVRREVFAALALPDLRSERELPYGEAFTMRCLDPQFERIALCRARGSVEIRSTADGQLLATLPASTNLLAFNNAEWSADGKYLAVKRDYDGAGALGDWEIWEVAKARRILLLHAVTWNGFSFHPKLPRLIAAKRGYAELWNLEHGLKTGEFELSGPPRRLRFSPEADRVTALFRPEGRAVVSIHDATNGMLIASHVFSNHLLTVTWHPDGRWLATLDDSGAVRAVDAQSGVARLLGRQKADGVVATFSPDGHYLFTSGWEREFICWDARTMARAFTTSIDSHTMQISADGRRFAALKPAGIAIHTFEQPGGYREFSEDLGERLLQAAFSADGRWLAASAARRMGLWDFANDGPGALAQEGYEGFLFFTPDGKELFASRSHDRDSAGLRWQIKPPANVNSPPLLEKLPLHKPTGFTFLHVHSNSVAMTTTNGSQLLARERFESGPDTWLASAAGLNRVSPDGRWLAIAAPFSEVLHVYRLPEITGVARLTHGANLRDFQFSPDGTELSVTSRAGLEFWSTETWERKRWLTNFSSVVIIYDPLGRGLWLTKELRDAGLYDAQSLEPLLLLPAGMLPLALRPDGQRLAVSVDMRRLQVWDLAALRDRLRELGMDWR